MSDLLIDKFRLKKDILQVHRAVLEYLFNTCCDADNAKIANDYLPPDPYNRITDALAQVDLESSDSTLPAMLAALESRRTNRYHKIAYQILYPMLDAEIPQNFLNVSPQFTCSAPLRNAIYAGWLLESESSPSIAIDPDIVKATVETGTPAEKVISFLEQQNIPEEKKADLYAACELVNQPNPELNFAANLLAMISGIYEYILNCLATLASAISSAPQTCLSFFSPPNAAQDNTQSPQTPTPS